ncbi:hypothetical protein C8Q69DRAFT_498000 [Paecilomyces variotii]|uniref:Uncharacterized protein n=1 Tax=Byssochlamys spectabilis TaxID=264951 RepID=A0A443HWW3_BYSSP|nr:hypothetical protein C8Q69DRAFT_498000 [Paecilomyces variotii]RWQ96313.1 hypothetical protein C8Q69DRAFT_498000 [Paecilomyces variotii]
MKIYFPRQANTCQAPLQFYRCSKGDFVGCCTADPCDTGVCPDGDGPKTTADTTTAAAATSLPSTATSTEETTTYPVSIQIPQSNTETSSIATTSSGTHSDSIVQTTQPITSQHTSTTSTTSASRAIGTSSGTNAAFASATSNSSSGSHSGSNGGLLGDEENADDNLQEQDGVSVAEMIKLTEDLLMPVLQKGSSALVEEDIRWKNVLSESSTVPSGTSDYEKKASPSLGSPGKAGGGRLMTTLEEDPCPLLASNPVIPTAELPASIPSRPDTTPELADTGRSPGRSELPPHADRELINIPIEARANARSWRVNRNHGPVTSNQAHIKTTRDGAIMRPNMNHESEEDTPSSYLRERGHIMSFMQYGNYNGTPPNSEAGSQRPTPIPQIEISPPMQDDAEGRESGTMPSSSSHRVGLGLSGIYMRQT